MTFWFAAQLRMTSGVDLAMQVKRNFTVRSSSPDCVQTFQRFWKDFNTADLFDPDHDVLVIGHSTWDQNADGRIWHSFGVRPQLIGREEISTTGLRHLASYLPKRRIMQKLSRPYWMRLTRQPR